MAQDVTSPIEPVVVRVAHAGDLRRAEDLARNFAGKMRFNATDVEEIALVVGELASNLLRHAGQGTLTLKSIDSDGRTGLQIESDDHGCGIPNGEQAITDGYSTAGGLGVGLGSINRLMDDLEIRSGREAGAHIVCRRWFRPKLALTSTRQITFGVATRSYRRLPENGDAFLIKRWNDMALAGVIDGLGHGPFAQRAAQTARQYIEHHFDQPLESLFRGTHRACQSTRGVVMALARFDLAQKKFRIASVGNVEVRLVGNAEPFNLIVRRGVIGLNAPSPVCIEHPWTTGLLIMHSDGLRSHWELSQFPHLNNQSPDQIARQLLHTLARPDDDATVLVAKSTNG